MIENCSHTHSEKIPQLDPQNLFSRTVFDTFSFFIFSLILGLKSLPLGPKRAGAKRFFFGAKRLFKGPAVSSGVVFWRFGEMAKV